MKKLDLGGISAGLNTLQNAMEQNAGIGWSQLVDAGAIDFARKNTYAADDTDESIRELADQIQVAGLLSPLGVVKEGGRYRLFSGERRYRAITTYLHWEKIPCQVFEGVSENKAQLMLHMANGAREYSPARKLELYEEYRQLLREMKESGEFSGGVQQGIAELLNVSDRQVRTYRSMSEQLTEEEKEAVSAGELSFRDARRAAMERAAEKKEETKTGTGSGFETEGRKETAGQYQSASTNPPVPPKDESSKAETGTGSDFGKPQEVSIRQLQLSAMREGTPSKLLLAGKEVQPGERYMALFPEGWKKIQLEVQEDLAGLGRWYIATPGFEEISPVGLFVKRKGE